MERLIAGVMGQDSMKFLPMCLKSLKDADKIVYIDGGSKDGSVEYAKSKGAEVIESEYNQDDLTMNGKQRNIFLEYIKEKYPNDWCLFCDCDEVVEDLSKIKKFIQDAPKGLYNVHMRHLIGDLAHEDALVEKHWVLKRLFKIECADKYPEVEHPILQPNSKESLDARSIGGTDCTVIWHLAYIPNLWAFKKKYENNLKKSNMHTSSQLNSWYYLHLFGYYKKKSFDPIELPKIILDEFGVDRDKLYFMDRNLELKHFMDAVHWRDHFKCKTAIEFGCGRGPRIFTMNQVGVPTRGIEISKYAVDSKFHEGVEQGDLTEEDLGRGSHDLVICYDVLEHIEYEDLDIAIQNLIDHSNKYVLISVPVLGDPNLENDPTHTIREMAHWWVEKFTSKGLKHVETPNHFLYKDQIFIFEK